MNKKNIIIERKKEKKCADKIIRIKRRLLATKYIRYGGFSTKMKFIAQSYLLVLDNLLLKAATSHIPIRCARYLTNILHKRRFKR